MIMDVLYGLSFLVAGPVILAGFAASSAAGYLAGCAAALASECLETARESYRIGQYHMLGGKRPE